MPTAKEIRQQFLDFFRERSHKIVPSAPIVNKDDFVILTEISVRCDTQKQQLFDVLSKHLLQIEHTINGDRVALLEQVVVESY